ncbi:MAG: HAD hydrolase-like protein [Alphaproteobacteria bacterium]|nr:HAD hydrolase-like protein [Alphaproteobacteria bacterium]
MIWDFDGVLAPTDEDWAAKGYPLTDGVREVLALPNLRHCVATNGTLEQTLHKIKLCGLDDVFNAQNVFTIDMAGAGKGAPDIFLLALAKMNEKPENTAVVDNSYTAMKGVLKAGCLPIAFLSRARYDDSDWPQRLKNIGVEHICCEMSAVKKLIEDINRDFFIVCG